MNTVLTKAVNQLKYVIVHSKLVLNHKLIATFFF